MPKMRAALSLSPGYSNFVEETTRPLGQLSKESTLGKGWSMTPLLD
jgi:hypothetical protein